MPRYCKLTPEEIEKRLSRKRAEYRATNYQKLCKSCWRKLPRESFYRAPSRYDGCSTYCIDCDRARAAARWRRRQELHRILIANGAGVSHVENVV